MQKQKGVTRHKKKIRSIAVLTSGGDAPGMNAAIRAVVRYGIASGLQVYGLSKGYTGLVEELYQRLELSSVANIIQRGGTVLKTDRCPDFLKKSVRTKAITKLRQQGIDGLIVIGGDGTFRGAHALWQEAKLPVIGLPGTIDNDLYGTDASIGFDTAVNTCIHAIDQIRDTAGSHDRTFLVEVMGRNTGYIALDVGIGGGAEAIVLPESPLSPKAVADKIARGIKRGKTSSIIVVAEGPKGGRAMDLQRALKRQFKIDAKVCILGHVQRGGSPSAYDRKLASRLGAFAVAALAAGYTDAMAGLMGDQELLTPFSQAVQRERKFHGELVDVADRLAT